MKNLINIITIIAVAYLVGVQTEYKQPEYDDLDFVIEVVETGEIIFNQQDFACDERSNVLYYRDVIAKWDWPALDSEGNYQQCTYRVWTYQRQQPKETIL